MQIPVVNESEYVSNTDVLFMAEACQQSLKDCADAWGQPSDAVVAYSSPPYLNGTGIGRVASIVDDISEAPGAEAYHTDQDGVIFSRVLAGLGADIDVVSVGLDHENKEEKIDPDCTGVVKMPDGKLLAKEVCDPVQGDVRKISVTIGDTTRAIAVSNFVLPAYFDASAPGPYDAFGVVSRPFEIRPGGYQEITDPVSGETNYVFADKAGADALERKRANPGSRLYRRIAKRAEVAKALAERAGKP